MHPMLINGHQAILTHSFPFRVQFALEKLHPCDPEGKATTRLLFEYMVNEGMLPFNEKVETTTFYKGKELFKIKQFLIDQKNPLDDIPSIDPDDHENYDYE